MIHRKRRCSRKRLTYCVSLFSVLGFLCTAALAAEIPLDLLEPPAEGKAVIYFFNPGKTPVIPSIPLSDQGERLPILLGAREYYRHECDPGYHAFAISADESVRGYLEEGGVYAAVITTFLAVVGLEPLTGRVDLLVGMKKESEQWDRIRKLMQAKPPKPPGKDRDYGVGLEAIAVEERKRPVFAFSALDRLNPLWTERVAVAVPYDRLPDPVPGKSLVVFFAPERNPEQEIEIFEGYERLVPALKGGAWYVYETTPGTKEFWVPELRVRFTALRLIKAELEAGKVYPVYVDESLGFGGARIYGLTGKLDHVVRRRFESEAWYRIEQLPEAPAESLRKGGALVGDELKDVKRWLKKKSKKRWSAVTALK